MAATTTSSAPIPHQTSAGHDLAGTAAGTTFCSIAAPDSATGDCASVTGPAFVVTDCVLVSALPFPTSTAPTMPGWYVQT